jgi:hypothetical protein
VKRFEFVLLNNGKQRSYQRTFSIKGISCEKCRNKLEGIEGENRRKLIISCRWKALGILFKVVREISLSLDENAVRIQDGVLLDFAVSLKRVQ